MTPCPRVDESHDHKSYSGQEGHSTNGAEARLRSQKKASRVSSKFLNDREVNLVLEVGAHVGQFGTALRADGYFGTILSFESASGQVG